MIGSVLKPWILAGITLIGLSIAVSGCKQTAVSPTASTEAVTQTASPPSTGLPAGYQTYANAGYGFAFDYPSGWQVTENILPPGTELTLRSHGRYDVRSGDHELLLVEAANGPDWILEIAVRKGIAGCGGQGPVPDDDTYERLQILGRSAARMRPEDGRAWDVPEPHEPLTVPVMFYRLPGECTLSWPDETIPAGQVVFLWDIFDDQAAFDISIVYYSNQFTRANLQNRSLDYRILSEMDEIVQSLRLLEAR